MPGGYNPTALSVFISYSWDSKVGRADEVRQLADCLRQKKKLNIWLDVKQMVGNFDDRMREGILSSDIAIIFFSEAYEKSENCRKEAEFAEQRKKLILPVRMQPGYQLQDSWLAWLIGKRLWVDFKPGRTIDDVGEEITTQLMMLFNDSNRNKFRLINPQSLHKLRFTNLNFQQKLEAIKNVCQMPTEDGGLLVISGDEGVGKTYFMSLLLLRHQQFLQQDCKVGTIFWLNCYPWHDQDLFESVETVRTKFRVKLMELVAEATKRGISSTVADFAENVRILKEDFQSPPLFIFDDVYHFPLLEFIRQECKSLPCIAITRTHCLHVMQNQVRRDDNLSCQSSGQKTSKSQWEQLVNQVEIIEPLPNNSTMLMLRDTFGMKNISPEDLRKMADDCEGLPRKAAEKAFPPTDATPVVSQQCCFSSSNETAKAFLGKLADSINAGEAKMANWDGEPVPDLKFIEVPQFDNYFVRPEEEDVLRNGFKFLSNKGKDDEGGFFVIEGCGGIGKSTLVSHILRDSKHKAFFQRECNIQTVIWLNCYQWREGCDEKLFENLQKLVITADSSLSDPSIKTLQHVIDYFDKKKLRILFVLDDVFHYSILDEFRSKCPAALCCAVTRDASILRKNTFNPFLKFQQDQNKAKNPCQIGYLNQERIIDIFQVDFELKGKLKQEQLVELAKRSFGMPLIVGLIGGQMRDSRNTERAYKKLIIENGKLGNLEVGKTGRGEKTACQLFDMAWEKLLDEDRHRYYTFLLFDPVEEIEKSWLQTLWNFDDVEDAVDICHQWENASLVRHTKDQWDHDCYSIHQILHESSIERALVTYRIEGNKKDVKKNLSRLRLHLLIRNGSCENDEIFEDTLNESVANLLSFMMKIVKITVPMLWQSCLDVILRKIDPEILAFLDKADVVRLSSQFTPNDLEEVLMSAARSGQHFIVKFLLTLGCNIETEDSSGNKEKIMSMASRCGQLQVVRLLVTMGANVEAVNYYNQTALMFASSNGQDKVVEFLITNGADVNKTNNNDTTILMAASSWGHDRTVDMLIEAGAEINAHNDTGRTALMFACQGGHDKVVQLLLSKGAEVDAVTRDGETALMIAAQNGREKVVEMLVAKGANTNASCNLMGSTVLHYSIGTGTPKIWQLLLAGGADPNSTTRDGSPVIVAAAYSDKWDFIELLVNKVKVDIEARDESGLTVLIVAARRGSLKTVRFLITKGANINACDSSGYNALIAATFNGHRAIVDLLLAKGAHVDDSGERGEMLLRSAACGGHVGLIERLTSMSSKTVNIDAPNSAGLTALMWAVDYNHKKIIEILIEKGANLEARDKNGETVLFKGARNYNYPGDEKISERVKENA